MNDGPCLIYRLGADYHVSNSRHPRSPICGVAPLQRSPDKWTLSVYSVGEIPSLREALDGSAASGSMCDTCEAMLMGVGKLIPSEEVLHD